MYLEVRSYLVHDTIASAYVAVAFEEEDRNYLITLFPPLSGFVLLGVSRLCAPS